MTGPCCVTVTSMVSSGEPAGGLPRFHCFLVRFGFQPLVPEHVACGVVFLEPFDVEILVVGRGMGHAPRDPRVVPEVRKSGNPREGQPDHIEFGTSQMVLIVGVGGVQRPVGVSGQQRFAGGGAGSGQHPAIAAGVHFVEVVERPGPLGQFLKTGVEAAGINRAGRKYRQVAGLISREKGPGAFRTQLLDHAGPPCFRLKYAHEYVPYFVDDQAVPGLPRLRGQAGDLVFDGQRVGAFDVGVDACRVGFEDPAGVLVAGIVVGFGAGGETEPAHQLVLSQSLGPHHFGPPAAAPTPVVLHVPEPVLCSDEPLGEERVQLTLRLDVGNSPLVPVHLGRRVEPIQLHRAGQTGKSASQVFYRQHSAAPGEPQFTR